MRFAVHGPGCPVASPRSHGVPRRDVNGRVHISVTGETAGSAPEHGLALTRAPVHPPARRAPLARKRGSDLLHPARGLLLQSPHQQPPPGPQYLAVEPGLGADVAARVLPGAFRGPGHVRYLQVLDPDKVEPPCEIRACLLGPVFAPVGLAGLQPGDRVLGRPRRFDPRLARACVRCSRRSLVCSRAVRPGACSIWPVDRAAETATPRSMPTVCPLTGAGTGAGITAKATCQRPARSRVIR
jgi:hypothetical protein